MNLYRKYRSQKFADVVGQEHVVQVLSNALKNDNVGHAYLFSGPRGTGKTSVARLLAKSLNCQNRQKTEDRRQKTDKKIPSSVLRLQSSESFEPCDQCQSCQEILAGSSMDVMEIDAASNRGIDEIRELRDKIKFAPSGKKFKVFIIDEVHMLTKEAFNALLKTLEEPPAHAIFVLATTELHKVPDTIISRTQQFDFKRANMVNLISRLNHIAKLEKIDIDEESLKLIARAAEGSYRDAISFLDQVSGLAKKITTKETRSVLGLSEWQTTIDFLQLIANTKAKEIFDLVDKLYLEGIDFSQFTSDLLDLVRRMMLSKIGYKDALESFTDDQIKHLNNITAGWQMNDFIKYIRAFDQAKREMKLASMAQLPLEMAALELTQSVKLKTQNNSIKVKTKEQKPVSSIKYQVLSEEKSKDKKYTPPNTKYIIDDTKKIDKEVDASKKNKTVDKSTIDLNRFKKDWPELIEKLIAKNHSLSILLKDSTPLLLTSDSLTIGVPFKFSKDRLEGKKIYADVCEIIQEHLGIDDLQLKFKIDSLLIGKQSTIDNQQQTTNPPATPEHSNGGRGNSQLSTKSQTQTFNPNSELLNDAMEVFG